ncbi:MAG: hypothetical protein IPJ31_07455, partial [Bacteroidetes bacterium]|nr:hypothetical protein [Bacteroidota bacterium]
SPTITINTTTPVTCVPGCDGTATTITAGGTPGYTYAISGGALIDALGNASNLCAGIVYDYCYRCQCLFRYYNGTINSTKRTNDYY